MNIQLFGADCPPFYKIEDSIAKIDKVTEIDEKINASLIERESYVEKIDKKINALLIEREAYVEDLKKSVKKENTVQGKN